MPELLLDPSFHHAALAQCATPHEVLQVAHDIVSPYGIFVLGSWRVPLATRRGSGEPYQVFSHPSLSAQYWSGFWRGFKQYGPSFLARHAFQMRRDFTMLEAIVLLKPTPEELWIVRHVREHGIVDLLYAAPFDWMFFVYWSDRKIALSPVRRAALVMLAYEAAKRIEFLIGTEPQTDAVKLTVRQRQVWKALMSNGTPHLASIATVAAELRLSTSTVKTHVRRVEEKLGVHSLEEAAVEIVRRFVVLGLLAGIGGFCVCGCEVMHLF